MIADSQNTLPFDQIYGFENTTAQEYAEKYNKEFEVYICDHVWNENYTIDKEATCTETGNESIHCSICDAVKEDSTRVIPAVDHTYERSDDFGRRM